MSTALPRHYEVDLEWGGWDSAVLLAGDKVPIFGGSGEEAKSKDWSPEQLLLSALSLCLMRSFEVLARREPLHVRGYHSRTEASLTMTSVGVGTRPGFTLVTVHVDVEVAPEDVVRARELMVQAKQLCVVANALMPPVHLELNVGDRPLVEVPRAFTCR
jgi:organic hydroperoxide reductase OsmC/OhrA